MDIKAQADVIAIVIIVGIVTALAGTAYMWGAPLIEKRSAFTDYKIAESFVVDLDKKITEIASSGGGEANIKIPTGMLKVFKYEDANADRNSLVLEFISKQPLIMGGNSYIQTTVLGEDAPFGSEPRIINVTGTQTNKGYVITLKLHYRNLVSPNGQVSAIALDTESATGKPNAVQIRYEGDIVISGKHLTKINVNVQ